MLKNNESTRQSMSKSVSQSTSLDANQLQDIKINDNIDTNQKSINSKINRSVSENAPSKYEEFIKEHCKNFNVDWLNAEFDYLLGMVDKHDFRHDFSLTQKEIPELKEVLKVMIKPESERMFTRSIEVSKSMGISRRTARKYLLRLCKLRWCMKGRWVTYTDINPFLQFLFFLSPKTTPKFIRNFVPKQVDLLDMFSFPLLQAYREKVNDVKFIWSQKEPNFNQHYYPAIKRNVKFYPYFNGTLQIKAETDNGDFYATLPYNIHWTGRNKHVTLPMPFKFYGIQECGMSDKSDKLKVHFDNSITVGIPLGSASYSSRKLLHSWGQTHWSDMANRFLHKFWKNEYVECFDFKTHEEIIKNRLFYKAIPIKQVEESTLLLKQIIAEI
ncbi:MAG: hypothetical protein NWF06_03785 [Candidatus Bathyarchaeota archaeon]|nr:hypothetical protein [Candidatus Bathyarchaeum sp.]